MVLCLRCTERCSRQRLRKRKTARIARRLVMRDVPPFRCRSRHTVLKRVLIAMRLITDSRRVIVILINIIGGAVHARVPKAYCVDYLHPP